MQRNEVGRSPEAESFWFSLVGYRNQSQWIEYWLMFYHGVLMSQWAAGRREWFEDDLLSDARSWTRSETGDA
jgi:hypothetical protein